MRRSVASLSQGVLNMLMLPRAILNIFQRKITILSREESASGLIKQLTALKTNH
jgi:hypothetical protein